MQHDIVHCCDRRCVQASWLPALLISALHMPAHHELESV